jgi:hypothetical protein
MRCCDSQGESVASQSTSCEAGTRGNIRVVEYHEYNVRRYAPFKLIRPLNSELADSGSTIFVTLVRDALSERSRWGVRSATLPTRTQARLYRLRPMRIWNMDTFRLHRGKSCAICPWSVPYIAPGDCPEQVTMSVMLSDPATEFTGGDFTTLENDRSTVLHQCLGCCFCSLTPMLGLLSSDKLIIKTAQHDSCVNVPLCGSASCVRAAVMYSAVCFTAAAPHFVARIATP